MRDTLVAVAAGALVAALVGGCGGSASPPVPSHNVGTRLNAALPRAVLDTPLTTNAGRIVRLSSFRHKIVVLSDMMTLCQETCPLDTATLVEVARAVDRAGMGDRVVFLSLTVDPARDTPAQIRAYRKLYAPVPANWLTLTGDAGSVDRIWRTLGVYHKKVPAESPAARNWRTGAPLTYDIEHSDEVFFLDANQHERFVLDGVPQVGRAKAVPGRLYRFMDAQGYRNLRHPSRLAWTLADGLAVVSWLTKEEIRTG
jgi:cytochrome oxidase Cu insertion factor (SCO1/SenC/PrrC family)